MRDMRDERDGSGKAEKGLKRGKTLFFLLALLALSSLTVSAQGLQRSATPGLQNRSRTLRSNLPAAPRSDPAAVARANAAREAEGGTASASASELNFNQAPIDMVFETYGKMVGKTILRDPQVPAATITLKSEAGQKLTLEEQIEALEVVLEMNGIHMEPYGEKFMKALPRKEVRKEGIPLIMDPNARIGESGKVISMMIPFKNIGTEEAQKALEGFKSASGILLVFERTNSILATDTEQNISRMLEIARTIDVASPVTEVVEYIQIKYANANEVKQVIDSIVQESQKEQEKDGKQVNNAAQNNPSPRPLGGSLLRRPGQPNQPQAPANNESLVMTVSDADRGMIRGKVVTIADERSNKILLITNAANMKFFKDVIAALDVETTPDTVVKVYRLKYAEAEDVSDMINDLIGNSSSSKDSKGNQNQNAKKGTSGSVTRNTQQTAKKPANQRAGETKAGELNKDNTTVLADKRINGIVVMTDKELVPTIEQIIESMDIKLSQVLIETVIIEVNLGDGIETGIDWVRTGRQYTQKQATDANGNLLYFAKQTTTRTITDKSGNTRTETSTMPLTKVVGADYNDTASYTSDDGLIKTTVETVADTAGSLFPMVGTMIKGNLINGDDGYASMMGGGAGSADGTKMLNNVVNGWKDATPVGGGLNYFLKSDKLNLAAVIKASKTDSRTKYVASPVIMTLDNKEAVINATKMRYLLKGFTSSGNSYSTIAVPDYEQKELGIEIKVTPKINPNGTVMLTVEEKYSQVAGSQDIKYATGNTSRSSVVEDVKEAAVGEGGSSALETVNVDTTSTREMSADVLLENGQSVIFGGLTETFTQESETGIPLLKDIPVIGRWLFGSVSLNETRSELLVFMTPYVLDDAQAAQAEALRRKKTLSDPRPWEDHGWSLSPLADPVSKKEQMRRIKDEWKRQDEERKTKLAIEKAKLDRAKELEKMSASERKLWLEMHKKELDEEKQEELEEKMLDEKSQEELKKLAAEIKAKKLGTAEKAIEQAEKETAAENERGKLDAAKKTEADKAATELKQKMVDSASEKVKALEAKPAPLGK